MKPSGKKGREVPGEHYAALIEQVHEFAIFFVDKDGIPLTWNKGVGQILGFSEEEWIGKEVFPLIFIPEDVEAGIPQRELEVAAEHGSSLNDRWMSRKGGIHFYASGITTRILNDQGELAGFAKVLRDQTDQRLVEERLRESEEHLRMALSASDMGTWLYRVDSDEILLDEFLVRMLGLPEANHAWKIEQLVQVVHPEDRPWLAKEIQRALDEGGTIRSEFRLALPEMETRWLKIQGRPLDAQHGHARIIAGACLDITLRRKQELALLDADRRKDEFLATLAHELRNPLAPLHNGMRILELADNDKELRRTTHQMMDRQITHMVRLVDDLLDVSRISQGTIELRKEPVALHAVLEQALEASRPAIERAGHELHVLLPPDPLYVEADVTRLVQIFNNLLNNASKYTERGGNLSLTLRSEGGEAIVSVADDGMGIPQQLLSEVFEMFTQVDRTLDRSRTGLGIGLSIVKRLVAMHGGRVEAYSDGLGTGSRFLVYLPLTNGGTEVLETDQKEMLERSSEKGVYHKIMVVDDNHDAASTLANIFRVLGHQVRTAKDGREGVDVAGEFRPQLIFMDIGMPGLNGHEACREIRQQPWGKDMTIVALTGWGQEEERMRSKESGFDQHLVKPLDGSTVAALLRELNGARDH